jgi:hypothetical protein
VLLSLAACSDDPPEMMPPPVDPGLPLEKLCVEIAAADCARLDTCGLLGAPFDLERCKARQQGRCQGYQDAVSAAVATGELTYFELSAKQCRERIKSLGCEAGVDYDWQKESDCTAMFAGMRGDGEGCTLPVSCTDGHFCDGRVSCPGQCRKERTNNEMCSGLDPCTAGFFCASPALRCHGRVALGAPCETSIAGNACVDGTFCDTSQPGAPECAPVRGRGTGCQSTFECAVGLRCYANRCSGGELGDTCLADVDCLAGTRCVAGYCRMIKTEGAECAANVECAEGFSCPVDMMTMTGTCTPQRVLGSSCAGALTPCYQARCDVADQTCVAPLADGAACALPRDCLPGRACTEGQCTPAAPSCSG